MGEQDVLPSTQDAQVGSDAAEATLPAVVIAPQAVLTPEVVIAPPVSSGKVIDALRQFLPREVMVEVVDVIEREEGRGASVAVEVADEGGVGADAEGEINVAVEAVADDVFASDHGVEDDIAIAVDTDAHAHVAHDAEVALSEAACVDVDAEVEQREETCVTVDAEPAQRETACENVDADAEQDDETCVTADVVAAQVADDLPRVITPAPPVTTYGGALPASLVQPTLSDPDANTPHANARGRRSLLNRLSHWLIPDVVGRWMQHPVLSILAGVAFALLVLWWILGGD